MLDLRKISLFLAICFTLQVLATDNSPLLNSSMKDFKNFEIELYKKDKSAIVILMAFGTMCPVVKRFIPEINSLSEEKLFKDNNIKIFLLQSELYNSQEDLENFIKNYELKVPILKDPNQTITKRIGLTISSEVVVYDNQLNRIIYKGAIHDGISIDSSKSVKNHFLKDAIAHWLQGDIDKIKTNTKASGCHISFQ